MNITKILTLLRQKLRRPKRDENPEQNQVTVTANIDPEELEYSYLSPRQQAEFTAKRAADNVVSNLARQPQLDLNESPLSCGPLTLDVRQAWLQYKAEKKVDISPDNLEIRLLQLLLQSNEIVLYITIAKELKLPNYRSDSSKNDDESIKKDVHEVMKKLKRRLLESGMPDQEFSNIIKPVKNVGYIARYDQ